MIHLDSSSKNAQYWPILFGGGVFLDMIVLTFMMIALTKNGHPVRRKGCTLSSQYVS